MTTHDPKAIFYSQLLSEANDRVVNANAEIARLKAENAALQAKSSSDKPATASDASKAVEASE